MQKTKYRTVRRTSAQIKQRAELLQKPDQEIYNFISRLIDLASRPVEPGSPPYHRRLARGGHA